MSSAQVWLTMRLVILVVLFTAIAGKLWKISAVPSAGEGIFRSIWFSAAIVDFEIIFITGILSGICRKSIYHMAIFIFAIYLSFSFLSTITGQECECFGSIPLKSGFSMTIDARILCGLLLVSLLKVFPS